MMFVADETIRRGVDVQQRFAGFNLRQQLVRLYLVAGGNQPGGEFDAVIIHALLRNQHRNYILDHRTTSEAAEELPLRNCG
jgi:hypothetical protein